MRSMQLLKLENLKESCIGHILDPVAATKEGRIMKLIYVDECGPLKGWDSENSNQPCLSIGAISVDASIYTTAIEELKIKIDSLEIEHIETDKLGNGYEIKAKNILTSSGFWKTHPDQQKKC